MARIEVLSIWWLAAGLLVPIDEPPRAAVVKKLAEEFGDAKIKGDYASMIDHTYDGFVKELGGRDKAIEVTEKVMQAITEGLTIRAHKVGEPGEFLTENGNTFVIVPTTMEVLDNSSGKAVAIKSYLLEISADGGKAWKLADGACFRAWLEKKEIRDKLLPKLPAKLKLPDRWMRIELQR